QVYAVGGLPMHVRDDEVADLFSLDAEAGDRLGGLDEISDLPLLDNFLAVETGLSQDVAHASRRERPHHLLNVPLARLTSGRHHSEREVGNHAVADGVDFIDRLLLAVRV